MQGLPAARIVLNFRVNVTRKSVIMKSSGSLHYPWFWLFRLMLTKILFPPHVDEGFPFEYRETLRSVKKN